MKICAIICEFNPFHNGHKYILEQAREKSGCDFLVCVMSGQFTQRGEICRNDKFDRARHAVFCGADAVVELPTPFAVAPAEIFARGAMKVIERLKGEITIAFGCESGNKEDFLRAAEILKNESLTFKKALDGGLCAGQSFIKSYERAFEACGGKSGFISSPNNILGIEYAKVAVGDILPIIRIGESYLSGEVGGRYPSARAIRENAESELIKIGMTERSYKDFVAAKDLRKRFDQYAADRLFDTDKETLKRTYGCSEGLENRIKKFADGRSVDEICAAAAGKRYTEARIRRIVACSALNLYADECAEFLKCELPVRVLAVKKDSADGFLPLVEQPNTLSAAAEKCDYLTSGAYALWRYLAYPYGQGNPNEKTVIV